MNTPKILISITRHYILEAYFEYIIRYLGSEFIIDQAYTPYPPYDVFMKDPLANGNNPMMRNPDEYDLIIPHFPTHWNIYGDEHWQYDRDDAKKIGLVLWDDIYHRYKDVAVVGSTNSIIDKKLGNYPFFKLRLGIDFDLFKPYQMARDDGLLRVGIIGHYLQPRRMMEALFDGIRHIDGVKFMLFPSQWEQASDHHDSDKIFKGDYSGIYPGDKWFNGLPNVYNSIDVLLRIDEGIDYGLPVCEAAACGKPSISTDGGNITGFKDAEAALVIKADEPSADGNPSQWYQHHPKEMIERIRTAIEYMRDNPFDRMQMGENALDYVHQNYSWERWIPHWRQFFLKGVENAHRSL